MLALQGIELGYLCCTVEFGLRRLSETQEIARVCLLSSTGLTSFHQALQAELADRLQELQARCILLPGHLSQQALIQQRGDPFQDVCFRITERLADNFGRFQGAATYEDGKVSKERLLLVIQEIIAPLDGLLQGLLAGRDIADGAGKEVLSLLQAREQGLRRKELAASGGQFKCQGQSIQAHAYLSNSRDVYWGQLKIGVDGLGPLTEEGDRARAGKHCIYGKLLKVGQGQWGDGKYVFTLQMQHGTAGHQELQSRASEQQC